MSAAKSSAIQVDAPTSKAAKAIFEEAESLARRGDSLARDDTKLREARAAYDDAEKKYAAAKAAAGTGGAAERAAWADADKARAAAEARRAEAEAANVPKDAFLAGRQLENKAAAAYTAGDAAGAKAAYVDAEKAYAAALQQGKARSGEAEAAARAALAAMVEAKNAAEAQGGRSSAQEEWSVADNLEKVAGASFASKDYVAATQQYKDAKAYYEKALEAAKTRSADPAFTSMMNALKVMESTRDKASSLPGGKKPDAQMMAWARAQEDQGRRDMKEKQYKRAEKRFADAKLFYDRAIQKAQ